MDFGCYVKTSSFCGEKCCQGPSCIFQKLAKGLLVILVTPSFFLCSTWATGMGASMADPCLDPSRLRQRPGAYTLPLVSLYLCSLSLHLSLPLHLSVQVLAPTETLAMGSPQNSPTARLALLSGSPLHLRRAVLATPVRGIELGGRVPSSARRSSSSTPTAFAVDSELPKPPPSSLRACTHRG